MHVQDCIHTPAAVVAVRFVPQHILPLQPAPGMVLAGHHTMQPAQTHRTRRPAVAAAEHTRCTAELAQPVDNIELAL